MKKPRKPKAKAAQTQQKPLAPAPTTTAAAQARPATQALPRTQTPPPSHRALALTVLRTWWGKLLALLALLGGIQASLGTIGFFKDAYESTIPDIQIAGDSKSPFSLPIIIKNNNPLLTMSDIDWRCAVRDLVGPGGQHISGIGFKFNDAPTQIRPNGTETFPCRVSNVAQSAIIVPIMKYTTLGIKREYNEKKFTWYGDSDPPRWVASDNP